MYSKYSVAAAVCSVVFPALASLAVALRLRARKIKSLSYATDDYLIIAALVSSSKSWIMKFLSKSSASAFLLPLAVSCFGDHATVG